MAVYAIADLHLGLGVSKPMNIFGEQWNRHTDQIKQNWTQIRSDETVVIAGDISWAMTLQEALPDLIFLDKLPGRKVLLKGKQDYWWTSLKKLKQVCEEHQLQSLQFLRNNGCPGSDDWMICGTRGWILPDDPAFQQADEKIYKREANRLQLSLESAQEQRKPGQKLLVAMHYPPINAQNKETLFTRLMQQFEVDCCVYGHIHGVPPDTEKQTAAGLIPCVLVAADLLCFSPWPVASRLVSQ